MEEFHNAHESHELHGIHDTHSILVNPQKLSQGLTRTFEGISIIFASLGSKLDVTDLTGQALQVAEEKAKTTATAKQGMAESIKSTEAVEKAEQSPQSEQAKTSEPARSPEPTKPTKPAKSSEAAEQAEPAKSPITLDDITKVIVEKIKQDRGNREKIEAIVHNYGVSVISQLAESKYESFLAELASL
ncbi:MAG: hypothetical protein IJ587_04735 [Synergistaceae bacterium]|nr:hypothetical protein [Synergistaceae bacterium]